MRAKSHVTGETKVLGHCVFTWREPLDLHDGPRIYDVREEHCAECISVLKAQGAVLQTGVVLNGGRRADGG